MAKRKKLNYELIPEGTEPYGLLQQARESWHEDLQGARIALAWRKGWEPDKDGHLVLGKCHKISDLHKELREFDFVIILNREIWNWREFGEEKKLALLDHELCHAAIAFDKDGNPKRDERGRMVFRTSKHDIEEFHGVVERHGCYKRDLEMFAEAVMASRKAPLLATAVGYPGAATQVQPQAPAPSAPKLTVVPPPPGPISPTATLAEQIPDADAGPEEPEPPADEPEDDLPAEEEPDIPLADPVRINGSGEGWSASVVVLTTTAGFNVEASVTVRKGDPVPIEVPGVFLSESEARHEAALLIWKWCRAADNKPGAVRRIYRSVMAWAQEQMVASGGKPEAEC